MAHAIAKRKESFADEKLQTVLDEIELRARVELAKLELSDRPPHISLCFITILFIGSALAFHLPGGRDAAITAPPRGASHPRSVHGDRPAERLPAFGR